MKRIIGVLAFCLIPFAVLAQTTGLVGQMDGGAIVQSNFNNNSDATGFNAMSLTPSAVVPATATTQLLALPIITKTTLVTTCSATTGLRLPALQRYEAITVINRSGGSCLIWPSIGATVETALGTNGATNAPFTMLTNTDVIFKPITAIYWVQ